MAGALLRSQTLRGLGLERALRGAFLFLFLALLVSCQEEQERAPRFRFTPLGIELSGLKEESHLELLNGRGELLLSYPPLPSENVLLVFPWRPEEEYQVRVEGKDFGLRSPSSFPLALLEVFAPLGSPGRLFTLYPDRKPSPASFEIYSNRRCLELGFLVTSLTEGLRVGVGEEEVILSGEFERRLLTKRLCLEEGRSYELFLFLNGRKIPFSFRRRHFDLQGKVRLISWRLPTDEAGLSLRYRREGLLVLPNPFFERLGYLLGIKGQGFSRYEPFAYQTLTLENLSPVGLNLLVRADFLDRHGRPVRGFYPPRFGMTGHYRQPLSLVYLPPGARERVVLPVYVNGVSPGEYRFRVSVQALGEESPFLTEEKRVGLTRGSAALAAGLLLILASGLSYSLFLALGLRRILARFALRELTLVALAGAVAFGLDFLGGMLSNVFYALLGPFNILVGGLITEVVHYLVFTAVLLLVPKPGFPTLTGLLHYLMNLVLFGGFRATDPFFLGTNLLVLEGALWLGRCWPGLPASRTVLSLSLADALNTLVSLVLHMTLYRLYFPVWYLWLAVWGKGFLYTLIGASLGLRLGRLFLQGER